MKKLIRAEREQEFLQQIPKQVKYSVEEAGAECDLELKAQITEGIVGRRLVVTGVAGNEQAATCEAHLAVGKPDEIVDFKRLENLRNDPQAVYPVIDLEYARISDGQRLGLAHAFSRTVWQTVVNEAPKLGVREVFVEAKPHTVKHILASELGFEHRGQWTRIVSGQPLETEVLDILGKTISGE